MPADIYALPRPPIDGVRAKTRIYLQLKCPCLAMRTSRSMATEKLKLDRLQTLGLVHVGSSEVHACYDVSLARH